jgi:arabinogalactan oligomer/maltooligosaccharide transport system substrate-binding protein
MPRFRWLRFWTFTALFALAALAVLVRISSRPAAPSTPPPAASPPPLDSAAASPVPSAGDPPAANLPAASRAAESPPSSGADGGTVVLWHSWAGGDGDALAAILERFRQERPNIQVETLFVPYGDLAQAYTDAAATGGGPDLMLAPGWWLRDLAAAQVLLPLESRISAEERTQYIPAAIGNLSWEGVLYGLPTNYELVALYYNSRLLDEEDLPAATEDLIDLALASPEQGAGIYTNFYHLFWGVSAYGGSLFDDDGRVVLEQTTGTAEFLEWLLRAKNRPGIFVDLDYGMLMERFKKEEYALFIDGPWSMGALRERFGADLGVAPLPAGPAGPARPWLSADGVFLNAAASPYQQELALTLARYMTNAESASLLAHIAGRLPAHRHADLGGDPLVAGFAAQAATAIPLPHDAEMEEVWGYAGDMIAQTLGGTATAEEAVLEAATLINEANGK